MKEETINQIKKFQDVKYEVINWERKKYYRCLKIICENPFNIKNNEKIIKGKLINLKSNKITNIFSNKIQKAKLIKKTKIVCGWSFFTENDIKKHIIFKDHNQWKLF